MPRRDGFPTNRELQVENNIAARDLFVAATERELQHKISDFNPAYEDKPLDHLMLIFNQRHRMRRSDGGYSGDGIYREELIVQPLIEAPEDTFYQGKNRATAMESIDFYNRTIKKVSQFIINDEFKFGSLTPEMIQMEWTADRDPAGHNRFHVNTFKDRPSKPSIVSAGVFIENAGQYVQSDLFDKDYNVRMINFLRVTAISTRSRRFSIILGYE